MNAALRIQIMADARQARAQLNQIRGQLAAMKRVIDSFSASSKKAAASTATVTAAQARAAASAAKVAQAESKVAVAFANATKAQNQAASSSHRKVAAENQARASVERVTVAQNMASQSTLRLLEVQLRMLGVTRASIATNSKFAANLGIVAKATDAATAAALKEQAASYAGIANKHTVAAASERVTAATYNTAAAKSAAAAAAARLAAAQEPEIAKTHQAAAAMHRLEAANYRAQAAMAANRGGVHAAAAGQAQLMANAYAAAAAIDTLSGAQNRNTAANLGAAASLRNYSAHLLKTGKDVQWLGRILVQNLTLPFLLVGGFGISMALEFETAMTRIRKVYGDLSFDQARVTQETNQLAEAFRALSDLYGVHIEEVAGIAAVWAQAGATGTQLAKVTRLSVEAMLLGDLDVDQATGGLITIMQAYRYTSDELKDVLALLNVVENETAVSFGDLLTVLQKSAGIARNAGVTIQELAALTASLIPTAGGAAEAGNALKSVINRTMNPTAAAADAFKLFGIEVNSAEWASKTFTERLIEMSDGWSTLDANSKLVFAGDVFGLYQANRGVTILDDLINSQGNYQKALKATASEADNMRIYQQELATLLASSPQAFKILTNRTRNLVIELGLKLIPVLNFVLAAFLRLLYAFQGLDPWLKKLIGGFVVLLAVLGPVLMLVGLLKITFGLLVGAIAQVAKMLIALGLAGTWAQLGFGLLIVGAGLLGYALGGLEGALWGVAGALTIVAIIIGGWPLIIAAAIAGVVALVFSIVKHWDGLKVFFANLMVNIIKIVNRGLAAMPLSFANAFRAVVRVVAAAAKAIYSWLSYLNPFARHSPSLVEQVNDGTQVISDAYSNMASSVVGSMRRVQNAARALTQQIASARRIAAEASLEENIRLGGLVGADAGTIRDLTLGLVDMRNELDGVKSSVDSQALVVEGWQERLDAAGDAVDEASEKLRALEDVVGDLDSQLSASSGRLQDWLSAPVTGTYAFEDAIFANQQAQNGLKLQIALLERKFFEAGTTVNEVRRLMEEQAQAALDLADANGQVGDSLVNSGLTADEARQKMAELRSEVDSLRGEELDLRLQGAGSDVLAGIQGQIEQSEAVRRQLAGAIGTEGGPVPDGLRAMVEEIDRLQAELDGLTLDGEILNLEEALALEPARKSIQDTQRVFEQSLDAILNGISAETAAQASLTAQRDAATAAMEAQRSVVDQLTASRDAIADSYDRERDKLAELEKGYRDLETAISDAQSVLDETTSLGSDIERAAEEAAGAGGGGGVTPGDFEVPEGTGGLIGEEGDLAALIDQLNAESQGAIDKMFDDIFGGVRDKWESFKSWFSVDWDGLWDGLSNNTTFQPIMDAMDRFGEWVAVRWALVWEFLKEDIWGPIADNILPALEDFQNRIMGKIQPLIDDIQRVVGGVAADVKQAWDTYMPGLILTWDGFVTDVREIMEFAWPFIQILWDSFTEMVGHAIRLAGHIIAGLIDIIRGVFLIIGGFLTGDWQMMWDGAVAILSGIWEMIKGIIRFALDTILSTVSVTFRLIWQAVSSIWTTVGAPIFSGMWNWIKTHLIDKLMAMPGTIGDAFRSLGSTIGNAFNGVKSSIANGLNTAINAVNTFSRGVNSVARALGLSFRIGMIGTVSTGSYSAGSQMGFQMAQGGIIPGSEVGSGFITNGARAIVGEGSKTHPEFVIPTDPKYRDRAMGLAAQLMGALGMAKGGQIPTYAGGGILNLVTSTADKTATRIWDATVGSLRNSMGNIGGLAGDMGRAAAEKLIVSVGNNVINKWLGEFWKDRANAVAQQALSMVGLGSIKGLTNLVNLGGGNKTKVSRSSLGKYEMGGTLPHIYAMENGAYVKGGRGGVLAHIGDGRHDELVQPLDGRSRGSANVIINGDLSFPNITGPGDAQKFIENLEALAG